MRIVHLSALCSGGAVAMLRIHRGLRHCGVDSIVHCAAPLPINEQAAVQLPKVEKQSRRWIGRSQSPTQQWQKRIAAATRKNAPYEAFSPPICDQQYDLGRLTQSADLLHIHWPGGLIDFETFFESLKIPVVWSLHDQNPYLGGFHYQHDVDAATAMLPLEYESREIKRQALRHTSLTMVANSCWNEKRARESAWLPPQTKFETIYLPLPIKDYQLVDKSAAKQKLGIPPGQIVIGFVSMAIANRRKGFADLLQSLKMIAPEIRQRITLLSFGHLSRKQQPQLDGYQWMHLGHLSADGEAQSGAYSAMDLFVIPSLEEAFGQTPVEALACGTPVIGTHAGGVSETVIDGQTGRLVPPRQPFAMAAAIESLIDELGLFDRRGQSPSSTYPNGVVQAEYARRGRDLVTQRHSELSVSRDMIRVYQEAIERHRKLTLPVPRVAA